MKFAFKNSVLNHFNGGFLNGLQWVTFKTGYVVKGRKTEIHFSPNSSHKTGNYETTVMKATTYYSKGSSTDFSVSGTFPAQAK